MLVKENIIQMGIKLNIANQQNIKGLDKQLCMLYIAKK